VTIEVVNTEQAAAWDGHEGDVWTDHADRYDRASSRIWRRFVDAELVGSTDRVLDVGCGKGAWSMWAALHGAQRVVGIELPLWIGGDERLQIRLDRAERLVRSDTRTRRLRHATTCMRRQCAAGQHHGRERGYETWLLTAPGHAPPPGKAVVGMAPGI